MSITETPVVTETVDRLTAAANAFELALDTPLVSGELLDWADVVCARWDELVSAWDERAEAHQAQYQEMMEVDQEIFRHVEQLRDEDGALAKEIETLGVDLGRLCRKAPLAERDHLRTEGTRQAVIEQGIALAVRIRKQEVAVKTWFMEAFNRDRGPVD